MPTGRPSGSKPTGSDRAGRPARLGTPVNCMMADSMSSLRFPSITTSVAPQGVAVNGRVDVFRSEEHTSELQSPCNLVCRLLLEKKKKKTKQLLSQKSAQQMQ